MKGIFAKPDMTFTFYHHGIISMYLENDYKKVNNRHSLIEFINKWLNDYDSSNNDFRKKCIAKAIFPLYQMITGRSYETKQFKTI